MSSRYKTCKARFYLENPGNSILLLCFNGKSMGPGAWDF